MSERRGVWSALEHPAVYEAFQTLIGTRRWMRRFAQETIRAGNGERVLDIGCGPAALLRFLPGTTYIGIDCSEPNIAQARRTYGDRGQFICDDVSGFAKHELAPIDVIVAIGILHHIDDVTATSLLRAAVSALRPGGRLVTADPCFHPAQSFIQRFIVGHDRGTYVRQYERYPELCRAAFPEPRVDFESGHFPFPHSICIMQAVAPR
jgi:2-polyprenyl-3-methyl-5-hydroxy-6-metoxy-1,4-benzoquinol methylase